MALVVVAVVVDVHVAVVQVVNVPLVLHGDVTAGVAVPVAVLLGWRVGGRSALVVVAVVGVVPVAVVDVVHMAGMHRGQVPAPLAVDMGVGVMNFVQRVDHGFSI
ncbi:hypothetical protein MCAG_00713 [Micromonospora sp. ATCC 39149]|nr:hypothetical protein MCAG_00713 [Micromonospora sp. ATCC 39149]